MSQAASVMVETALQQNSDTQTHAKPKSGGKASFEAVLHNNQNQSETQNMNGQAVSSVDNQNKTTKISDAKYDELQTDLTNKIQQINGGQVPADKGDVLADLLYTKSRMTLMKEAMSGIKTAPTGREIMGRFSFVENEYKQVEAIMKSNKDLSPGELLGLQARLYQVGQHIEVMSKVVDQVTGGIKTILNTNV